ncbi:terminase small subunit [Reyranella sp.]|uniref:terminase small subunit n=1 Tax=Reyranella sp. TaxID=1929291 RepID=UPI003D100873
MSALRFPNQERFCQEYVKDLDARSAAVRAGYVPSPNLRASVWRLMRNGAVQARIAELQEAVAKQAEAAARAEADWVVAQLVKIARADPRKFFHPDGAPRKVHELGDDEAAALSGFEPSGEAGKVIDRLKVLELLGRHFGLWPQKPPPPPSPQDVNLFEGMSPEDVRRVRDKVGRLLEGAGVDLPGSAPRPRQG